MKPSDGNSLNVAVFYDEESKLITVSLEQADRQIVVSFDIHEAQVFNIKIADAITAAILNKLNIALPPALPETRH